MIHEKVEHSIKHDISQNQLVRFSFSEEQYRMIKWERNEKEFWRDNHLYDIIKNLRLEGRIILICVDDKLETGLFQKYWSFSSKPESPVSLPIKNILKLIFQNVEVNELLEFDISTFFLKEFLNNSSKFQFFYDFFLLKHSPPPQF